MSKHIRLNMIVKDEAAVIRRCLASVKPWINSWVIVDTGSTDGTQQIIQQFMHDVPGQLLERPWKNFGYNRTEALQLALSADLPLADYLLFIDADETLLVKEGFEWSQLAETAYYFECQYDHLRYQRNTMIATRIPWTWEGVLHEYLTSSAPHSWHTLAGMTIFVQHDSARAKDPNTYLKDIALLEQGLKDEPQNLRYLFYLAQSYHDAGQLDKSRITYLQRAAAGGWEEERWMAQFKAAQLTERLSLPLDQIYMGYLQAWMARQQRAEPLYELARMYRGLQTYETACYFAKQAVSIAKPNDILFVDDSVYRWRVLDELAISATYCPAYFEAGKEAMLRLMREQQYPATEQSRLMNNLKFYTTP